MLAKMVDDLKGKEGKLILVRVVDRIRDRTGSTRKVSIGHLN
jgi:GTP-sensing pleiotropic transcriptional regulator CodY